MAEIKGVGDARTYDGSDLRIGIVHARWNEKVVSALVAGAKAQLRAAGVRDENVVVQSVPGSYELPYAVQRMHASSQIESTASAAGNLLSSAADLLGASASQLDLTKEDGDRKEGKEKEERKQGSTAPFDALIAIGVLIKGETMHFEYIADAVSHALMRVQLELQVPVIFGLLTVLNEQQALVRAGLADGKTGHAAHNHGDDWGRAAVELGRKRRGWAEGKFVD